MAAQTKTSFLAKKAGAIGKAHGQVKDKPAEVGAGSRLPDGIDAGIAQLSSIGIGQYKDEKHKGEPFFMATGIVAEPEELNGRRLRGLQTRLMPIPLCDTPERKGKKKTFLDHYDDFLNQLKLLCGAENTIGAETERQDGESDDAFGRRVDAYLQALMAELAKQKPYFNFRTWKGQPTKDYPNPQVNEVWEGYCEYTPPEGSDAPAPDAQDDSGSPPDADAPQDDAIDPPPGDDAVDVDQPAPDGTTDTIADAPTAEVLDALVEDADDTNKKNKARVPAQAEIERLGLAVGIEQKVIDDAGSFREVADLILATADGGDAPPDDAATETAPADETPQKGTVVDYHLRDAKGEVLKGKDKKTPVKPTQCDVMTVNEKTKTVTLKDLNTDKILLGADKKPLQVPWSHLEASA